jgi:hypothetical protein
MPETTSPVQLINVDFEVDGAIVPVTVRQCNYSIEQQDSDGKVGGLITMNLQFLRRQAVPKWILDNRKNLSGKINFTSSKREIVRSLEFNDAFVKAFSESVNMDSDKILSAILVIVAKQIAIVDPKTD